MAEKFGKSWWIEKGLLMNPARAEELAEAADHFPDDYTPMIFLTGDAHRDPPFRWAATGVWADFFRPLIEADKVVCHVEQYPQDVNAHSVPALFASVFERGKVFGWEHAVFPILESAMGLYMQNLELFPNRIPPSLVDRILGDMSKVAKMGYLTNENAQLVKFAGSLVVKESTLGKVRNLLASLASPASSTSSSSPQFLAPEAGRQLKELCVAYTRSAMTLRTGIHRDIAPAIQRLIHTYSDHIHLITCGDAHLVVNPLYQYIEPPIGYFGVVDPGKG
jgi:hypothetical protein